MSFIVLHADRLSTALADDPLVPAEEVAPLRDAVTMFAEAKRIHEALDQSATAARDAAFVEGYAAGHGEGLAAAEAERQAELFRIAMRDSELQRERQRDIARLALEVVRRIAGELGDSELVAGLAEQAATQVAPDEAAIVRVPPSALEAVRARLANRAGLVVEADVSLGDTDCVIETPLGSTHAGLETQLAQIERLWTAHG